MAFKWCIHFVFFLLSASFLASCQNDQGSLAMGGHSSGTGKVVKMVRDTVFLDNGGAIPIRGLTSGGRKILLVTTYAETDTMGMDPGLSRAGEDRATQLANIVQATPLKKMFITHFRRIFLTVKPTAQLKTVGLERFEPGDLEQLTASLSEKEDGVYLLCGEHEVIPSILGLWGEKVDALDKDDHSQLWLVEIGEQSLVHHFTY